MEKKDLMQYLSVVCDGESAIYACDEEIAMIRNQQRTFPRLREPDMPASPSAEHVYAIGKRRDDYTSISIRAIVTIISFFIVGIAFMYAYENMLPKTTLSMLFVIVLIFLLPWKIGKMIENTFIHSIERSRANLENKKRDVAALSHYNECMENYKAAMEIYREKKRIEDAVLQKLDIKIQKEQATKEAIMRDLQTLYGENILHHSFRNMIAVNQIREYIEMGVCSELEGPNGAYAQYLLDIRTNRICGSIEDLKKVISSSLSQIISSQSALMKELKAVNINISNAATTLNHQFYQLSQDMLSAQSANEATLADSISRAELRLGEIGKAIDNIDHNQYVALRHTNIRTYLLAH